MISRKQIIVDTSHADKTTRDVNDNHSTTEDVALLSLYARTEGRYHILLDPSHVLSGFKRSQPESGALHLECFRVKNSTKAINMRKNDRLYGILNFHPPCQSTEVEIVEVRETSDYFIKSPHSSWGCEMECDSNNKNSQTSCTLLKKGKYYNITPFDVTWMMLSYLETATCSVERRDCTESSFSFTQTFREFQELKYEILHNFDDLNCHFGSKTGKSINIFRSIIDTELGNTGCYGLLNLLCDTKKSPLDPLETGYALSKEKTLKWISSKVERIVLLTEFADSLRFSLRDTYAASCVSILCEEYLTDAPLCTSWIREKYKVANTNNANTSVSPGQVMINSHFERPASKPTTYQNLGEKKWTKSQRGLNQPTHLHGIKSITSFFRKK